MAGDLLHLLAVWCFGFLAALQVLSKFDPASGWTMLVPAIAAYAGAIAYARWSAVRTFLSLSLALPIIGLLTFVTTTPPLVQDARAADIDVRPRTPVVLVVLDELPLSSLLTSEGSIDAKRYPNFGRLAQDATWYSRATTVADHTTYAVPAILSGHVPANDDLPTLADYPHNLFTLLGGAYAVRAHEPVTRLCPVRYCPQQRGDRSVVRRMRRLFHDVAVDYLFGALPTRVRGDRFTIAEGWRVLVTNTRLEGLDVVRSIGRPNPLRTFYFMHVVQPHQPWALLPSGHHYNDPWVVSGVTDDWEPGDDKHWRADTVPIEEALQRHLLQVGAVDRLIGAIVDRLEDEGLYENALIVVTADHGASFRPDGWIRRTTASNLADIASVPLFVKYPGRPRGREDRRSAETVDIMPTIADVLCVRLPWVVDGRSLRSAPVARDVRLARLKRSPIVESREVVALGLLDAAARNAAWLGSGAESLYRIGPRKDLIGRPLAEFSIGVAHDADVHVPRMAELEHVRKSSGYVPAHFLARLSWESLRPDEDVAVAINGRVAAVTRPFGNDGGKWIDAMVDEALLHDGRNNVGVYAVRGGGSATKLVRLGGNDPAGEQSRAAAASG
jgi:hypothetical protein